MLLLQNDVRNCTPARDEERFDWLVSNANVLFPIFLVGGPEFYRMQFFAGVLSATGAILDPTKLIAHCTGHIGRSCRRGIPGCHTADPVLFASETGDYGIIRETASEGHPGA